MKRSIGTSRFSSLKAKLILYSFAVTLFALASLTAISFLTVRDFLRESLMSGTRYKLRVAMDHIDRDMSRLTQLANWFSVSTDVIDFVSSSAAYPNDRTFKMMSAYHTVRDSVYANGVDGYIDKVLIGGFGGHSIQFGLVSGHMLDFNRGLEAYERLEAKKSAPFQWEGFVEESFPFAYGNRAVPIAKSIYGPQPAEPIGFVFMAVNPQVALRYLNDFGGEVGTDLFIVMGEHAYRFDGVGALIDIELDTRVFTDNVRLSESGIPYVEMEEDGRTTTVVLHTGDNTGWILAQTLPPIRLTRQNFVFARLLLLVTFSMLLLLVFVLAVVEGTVNRPIARINRRVALISTGDFSHDASIEGTNELGNIGRAVNRMSRDIEGLIDRRIRDEQTRKTLEFQVLQHQINPHFLYNTLDSIKWMATIQKSPGIAEMVSALASLLRHAAQGADKNVTLERELELVGEYCVIQRYRSANLFSSEIIVREDALLKCRVVKFMLQPLVENAFMHGIEPKMAPGVVRIEASRPAPDILRIDVTDDGIGMDGDQVAAALKAAPPDKEAFNRIGLHNVDERLKLAFGPRYGLTVESVKGEFTKVSAVMPCVFGDDDGGDTCTRS